jgi:hypothetical protein
MKNFTLLRHAHMTLPQVGRALTSHGGDALPLSTPRRGILKPRTKEVLWECVGAIALGSVLAAAAWWGMMHDPAFDPKREPAFTAPGDPPPWAENHGKRWAE